MKRLAVLLLLAACGPDYEGYGPQCTLNDGTAVHGAAGVSCDYVGLQLEGASALMRKRGLATITQAINATSHLNLLVKPDVYWNAPPGPVNGEYLPEVDETIVSNDGNALFHESLHRLDTQLKLPGTLDHLGWDTRGYWAAIDEWNSGPYTSINLYPEAQ